MNINKVIEKGNIQAETKSAESISYSHLATLKEILAIPIVKKHINQVRKDERKQLREKVRGMKYPAKHFKKEKYIEFIGSDDSYTTIRRWIQNQALEDILKEI